MLKLQFVILWGVLSFASTIASPVTWEQLSGPFGGPIESQAIHTDGNHFALFDGALNLSSDNVTTWQTVFESALAFQIGLDDLVYVQGQDGLYFSQTGSAWNKLPDGPYNLDLNRMAIAVDGTLYFVDTANLYVSSDRALTWEVVNHDFEGSAHFIKIDDHGELWIFGGDKAFHSADGVTWERILDAAATIQDLYITSNNQVFAAVGDDESGAVFTSLNGGASWQSTTLPYAKKFYESPQGWLLGAGGTVECPSSSNSFISLNGGSSWSPVQVSGPVYNFAVNGFGDILLGSDGFFRSTNSGGTFQPVGPNRAHVYAVASIGNTIVAVTAIDSCFWRYWRSADGGTSWSEIDQKVRFNKPDAFFLLKRVSDDRIWLSLGYQTDEDDAVDKSVIYETTNGGSSWTVVREYFAERALFDFDKVKSTVYAWPYGAKYFDRSEDAGQSWEPIPTPFEFGELHAASHGLVYGFSRGDNYVIRRIYYSFDYGEPGSWNKTDVPNQGGTAQLYVDHMGLLYKLVSQQDGQRYSLNNLYRSTNYGASWTDIKPDSGLTVWKTNAPPRMAFDHNGGVYLWTPAYALLSRNAGLNWEELYRSSATAFDIQCLAPGDQGNIFAGFYASSIQRAQKQSYEFLPATLDGLEHPIAQAYGVVWVDYDADGLDDVFVVNDGPNLLYKNLGNGAFRQISSGEIVTDDEPSRAASWADYNNDGYPDCYVTNWNSYNSLYKNLGDGTFKKITSGNIVEDLGGFRSCAWIDVNNDGHLDIYIANVFSKNILYINDGTNHWTKHNTDAVGSETDETYGIGWCDFDNDGDLDLYLANSGDDKLYEQVGSISFQLVDESRMPLNTGIAVGCSWGDYNNDGWMDLFVANADKENVLYHNNGDGSFSRVFPPGLAEDIGISKGSAWEDVDNDGDLDLFVANNGSHFFYANNGQGGFEKESFAEFIYYGGHSLAAAWGDADNDGDVDLLLSSYDLQTLRYENVQSPQNWLKVKCIGTMTAADENVKDKSNRSAVGARVSVLAKIGGAMVWQTRHISTQSGHAGQNSIVQHFGLGNAESIDSLIVFWPSGKVQRLANLGVNRRITVLESGSTAVISEQDAETPTGVRLYGNYPNPFNPSTSVRFSMPQADHVAIDIYDTRGRLVRRLMNEFCAPGFHSLDWDGLDNDGRQAASGLYFCLLTKGEMRLTVKMTLLR